MIRIIFCGICGKMGKATYEETLKNDNFKIVAGTEKNV